MVGSAHKLQDPGLCPYRPEQAFRNSYQSRNRRHKNQGRKDRRKRDQAGQGVQVGAAKSAGWLQCSSVREEGGAQPGLLLEAQLATGRELSLRQETPSRSRYSFSLSGDRRGHRLGILEKKGKKT